MRYDFLLHIPLQVLTFVKLAKKRWFWKLGNKLIGGPCTLLYNPCWHFLVKLLRVVFAPVSSDDLIRMASIEISHSYLLQRSYILHHTCHRDHTSCNRCSKCYFYMGNKHWDLAEAKAGNRVQQLEDVWLTLGFEILNDNELTSFLWDTWTEVPACAFPGLCAFFFFPHLSSSWDFLK